MTRDAAEQGLGRLKSWLVDAATPLWAEVGWNARTGAFEEAIGQDGLAVDRSHRGRVTPRQVYAFAVAERLGAVLPNALLERGCETMIARFRRPDGLFRTLVARDGAPLEETVSLYDQAFVLLALATLRDRVANAEAVAVGLRGALVERLKHPDGGFHEVGSPGTELEFAL